MKQSNAIHIGIAAAVFAAVISCGRETPQLITPVPDPPVAEKEDPFITPSEISLPFDAVGGARTVDVSSNTPWTANSADEWIRLVTVSRDGIVISVGENKTDESRSGEVVLQEKEGDCSASIQVSQVAYVKEPEKVDERAALEAVYRALHGEDWSENENWCTDAPLKTWYGVMTNTFKGEEHVVYLHLQNVGAHGVLPSAIGDLEHLRELWIIGDEGITGSIPESFGKLVDLRDLSLSGTSVSGPIPACLSHLEHLEILGLDGNCLEGNLPLFLKDMPALYNFGFSQNCLDGQIDASLTETKWWNTIDTSTGNKIGEENLSRGQKEGHSLWL